MKRVPLAAFLLLFPAAAIAQSCEVPEGYVNQVIVDDGTMRVRYATDKASYGPTDDVHLYLVVQNLGETAFYLNDGTDPQDGHFILRPPFETWETCCVPFANRESTVLLYHPSVLYFFSMGTTLQPGQCRVWEQTLPLEWATDGVPGTYAVLGGMLHHAWDVSSNTYEPELVVPAGGAELHIQITGPVAVENHTWGHVKALYR